MYSQVFALAPKYDSEPHLRFTSKNFFWLFVFNSISFIMLFSNETGV